MHTTVAYAGEGAGLAGTAVVIFESMSTALLVAAFAALLLLGLGFWLPRGYAYVFSACVAIVAPLLLVYPMLYVGTSLPPRASADVAYKGWLGMQALGIAAASIVVRKSNGFGPGAFRCAVITGAVVTLLYVLSGLTLIAIGRVGLVEVAILSAFVALGGLSLGALIGSERAAGRGFPIAQSVDGRLPVDDATGAAPVSSGAPDWRLLILLTLALPASVGAYQLYFSALRPRPAVARPRLLENAPPSIRSALESAVRLHQQQSLGGSRGDSFEQLAITVATGHAIGWELGELQLHDLLGEPNYWREKEGHKAVIWLYARDAPNDWFVLANFDPSGRVTTIGINSTGAINTGEWTPCIASHRMNP